MLSTLFVPRTIPFEGVLLFIIALTALISLIRVKKSKGSWLMLTFFGCAVMVGLSRIIEGTGGGLLFTQLQDTFIILSGVFLIQFAYHFPDYDQPREARLILGVYILFALVALGTILGLAIEAYRYPENLITSPEYFWYLNPLAIILAIFLCLRRTLHFSGPAIKSAAGWRARLDYALKTIWQPPNKWAAFQRNLALALLIGMIQALPPLGLVTGVWANYMIAIGGLLVIASVALVFYNYTSDMISFNTKLVGISLTTLLIFMGIAGIHAIETVRLHQLESVTRQFQTVQEAIVLRSESADAPPLVVSYVISWPAPMDHQLADLDIHYLGENVQPDDLTPIQGLGGPVNAIKDQDGFVFRFAGSQFGDFYRHRFEHDGRVYEIGFPWLEYAQPILSEVNKYILLTILGALAILTLFPFFFRRHLFDPLDTLLEGVKNADQGKLDTTLPIFYADEIGMISSSFNRMITSLRNSNKRRDQYYAELLQNNAILEQEIRERENAQLALMESEKKYRTVVEEATQGIMVMQEGRRIFYNPAWLEMTGYSVEEYDSMSFQSLVFADDLETVENAYQGLVTGYEFKAVPDFRITTKSGDIKWLSVRGARIDWEGKPAEMVFIKDITERKQQELKLQSYKQQLQALASQLTLTEERERRRIAVELHDHVGQALALARIQLAAAQNSQTEAARVALLGDTSDILKDAIKQTRSLIFELSSPVLNEMGLKAAISEWLQTYAETQAGLKTELVEIGPDLPLSADLRAILFRNVRELLTNVIRHAQATNVRVTLEQTPTLASVTVQDDGIGFQADGISPQLGFGLFSIQEQMNDLGGSLTIQSATGEGTKITLCVPQQGL